MGHYHRNSVKACVTLINCSLPPLGKYYFILRLRERERETETETERQRQTDRQTETERDRPERLKERTADRPTDRESQEPERGRILPPLLSVGNRTRDLSIAGSIYNLIRSALYHRSVTAQ